ncbi:MAG: Hsp20/alpha crystallin family protein [Lachnospiraceae bacterium]|nr:Hsp20/alpha crystallin family protein [Lachnospiraceae bacterium]
MMVPSIFGENLFDDFFDDFFDWPAYDKQMKDAQKKLYGRRADNMMKTDVRDHDDHYEIDVDLPGFKKEELSLELTDGYLTIKAAKGLDKDEKEKKTGKYIRRERYMGSMTRSFYVGDTITQEDVKAEYKNGVLKLSLPKPDPNKKVEKTNYIAIEG